VPHVVAANASLEWEGGGGLDPEVGYRRRSPPARVGVPHVVAANASLDGEGRTAGGGGVESHSTAVGTSGSPSHEAEVRS
jgi:hypothetical protein